MNPDDKKEEVQPSTQPKTGKLQRKLKFKTLDGNIKTLECDYDIKISELKKKLQEIYNIEPIRQRLLNKGKQFKDDEYLDKLVDKDDTTIHLVFRSEADVKRMQEQSQNPSNTNTSQAQNQTQNNQNTNPFQNILSIVTNSDEIRNLTNSIVNQILTNPNSNSNNNSNANNNTRTISIGNTQYQTLNIGEALNLANSPLHPIAQPPNLNNPTPLNLNNNSTNTTTAQNQPESANIENAENVNKNNYSSQFPIAGSVTDKKYEAHLKNIEKELNSADELISQKIEPRIPLPLLNTTQNVFTAISRSLRKYVIVNQNILCHLMRLADLMEREQFITNSETRMTGNKLLDQAYKCLSHVSKASNDLSNVIKSSNFNTAPNTGYIGIVCQEIGLQSTSIPIELGDLNTNNILAALGGANTNNNTIVSQGQGQVNVQEVNTAIPINIVEVAVDQTGTNNVNLTVNNTNTQSNNTTTNTNTENNKANEEQLKKEKKNVKVEENKEKPKDDNKLRNAPNTQNINNTSQKNNIQANNQNNTQNNTQTTNQNNDFNNLFGNMMSQLMNPSNLNSIAGAVGSMLNNTGGNQSGSGGNNQNMGGLFGNLFSNLMGSLGDESDEEETNIQPTQPPQPQKKENDESAMPKKDTIKKEESQTNNTNTAPSTQNSLSLIKKLVESPLLRRETKISEESKIGEKMEPNIEFIPFSNDIIANLTVQEIFNMYNLNFSGLSRLRKDIQKKYFTDKIKNDETIKKVIELLCERFILVENQIDKLNPNKDFSTEDFLNKHLKGILNMFIDENEVNQPDSTWENKFRRLVIAMLISLINELKEVYETGEDGAKTFIEFNILTLIENLVGQKYLASIQNYDEDIINKLVENLYTIVKAEEIKNKCNKEKSDNSVNETERPSLLSVEEIFRIASKDKEKLEKEENSEENKQKKKYSDFYYLTSLYKG